MAHDVDVDAGARLADHLSDHGAARQSLPLRPPARAHHDLGDVQRARRLEQRVADVRAGDLVILAAELLDELALTREERGRGRREAVLRNDVDAEEHALRPLGDAGRAADEALAVRRPRQRHEHALPRLPGLRDPVLGTVGGEGLVDPVGEPGERKLAQRGEVAGPEVVGERRVDPVRGVDVAAREPVPQRKRSKVDQLELVGAAHDLIRYSLALLDPGDLLNDIAERLEVLDVEGGDDVDARVQQFLDVLPALLVPRAGDVRVRELVDERDLRLARQQCVDVQLLELGAAVVDALPRDDLEVADLVGRLRASVGLDEADDDVLAVVAPAAPLVEHGECLPDAGCGAEVDAERASGHEERLRLFVERQVELEHVHAGLAEEAERAPVCVLVDEPEKRGEIEAALACNANRLRTRIRG